MGASGQQFEVGGRPIRGQQTTNASSRGQSFFRRPYRENYSDPGNGLRRATRRAVLCSESAIRVRVIFAEKHREKKLRPRLLPMWCATVGKIEAPSRRVQTASSRPILRCPSRTATTSSRRCRAGGASSRATRSLRRPRRNTVRTTSKTIQLQNQDNFKTKTT
ncbi:MAG: hypothetical protein ACI9ZF_000942 [Bradyrhizobium sp.]|jgi:hypothetical protein